MHNKPLRVGVFLVSVSLGAWSLAQGDGLFKNLKVLPQNIDKPTLKGIMKKQAKALGVECDFCHEQPDMASDEKKEKKIAREMMRMTDEIAKGTLKLDAKPAGSKELVRAVEFYKKKLAGKKDVTCMTCHEGNEKPPGSPGSKEDKKDEK